MLQSGYGTLNFKSIPEKTNAALKTVSNRIVISITAK